MGIVVGGHGKVVPRLAAAQESGGGVMANSALVSCPGRIVLGCAVLDSSHASLAAQAQ